MKNISTALLLMFVFIVSSVFAQIHPNPKADTRQWRMSEEMHHKWGGYPNINTWNKTEYHYNQQNTLQVDSVRYYEAGADSVWSYSGSKQYGFEQLIDGYIVRIYSGSTDIHFPNYVQQVTRYNAAGNILYDNKYSVLISDSARYQITYSKRNNYDTNGRLNGYYLYDRGNFPYYRKSELTYDETERKILQLEYSSSDSVNYVNYYKTEYEYMTTGNPYRIYREYRYRWLNEAWTISNRTVYEYSYNDQEVYTGFSAYSDNIWLSVGGWHYVYDSFGHLIRDYKGLMFAGERDYDNYYIWTDYIPVENNDEIQCPPAGLNIRVMPNPFNSVVRINISNLSKSSYNASIYNIKGQLIRQWDSLTDKELVWDGKDSNIAVTSGGLYLLKIEQNGKTGTTKLLKYK